MTFANILLIFILIALNAFFVGIEFAAVTSRRARLDLLNSTHSRAYHLVSTWLEQPAARDRLIAASQLGITLVSLALGAVGENTFEEILHPYFAEAHFPAWLSFLEFILPALPLVISLTVVTSLHVVLGEQVPKVAVLHSPERFALQAAPIMDFFNKVFKHFIDLLDWATRTILALFGIRSSNVHTSMYSLDELKQIVSGPEVEGIIEQSEREMLTAVFDFGELLVRQVMVPRTEIIAVEANDPSSTAIELALKHSVTKLPVYEENLDHMIGIIHLRDLLLCFQEDRTQDKTCREIAREGLFVPETISVNALLREFRSRRVHIAIVLDEFGGTAGLVTLEDLLDEIIGEVQDSFDQTPPPIQTLPDGRILIEGMTSIEDVNESLGLALIDPDYDTIAGYILGKLGRIAQKGDIVEDSATGISLKVESMDRLRIAQVSIKKI